MSNPLSNLFDNGLSYTIKPRVLNIQKVFLFRVNVGIRGDHT